MVSLAKEAPELAVSAFLPQNLAGLERGKPSEHVKVAMVMQQRQTVPDGAGGDEAIHSGADGSAGATHLAIKVHGLLEDLATQGRLHQRQRTQGLAGQRGS